VQDGREMVKAFKLTGEEASPVGELVFEATIGRYIPLFGLISPRSVVLKWVSIKEGLHTESRRV